MNAYTTRGQARITQRDIATILQSDLLTAGTAIAALEWQRGRQAEAELDWLLQQHGVTPESATARVARLLQTIGAALVRAGDRLAGTPRSGVARDAAAAAGTLGTTG